MSNEPEVNYYPQTIDSTTKEGTATEPQANTPNVSNNSSIQEGEGEAKALRSLQSINYRESVSGWLLGVDGVIRAIGVILSGAITAVTGAIGGWIIGATTLKSKNDKVVLDSDNEKIEVGTIEMDGVNSKITVGTMEIDGVNNRVRDTGYVAGVSGVNISPTLVESENIVGRATLKGAVFSYDIVSAVGGQLLVSNSDTLASDTTALDASTFTIKGNTTFAINDIWLIRAVTALGIQEEYLRVTNIGSAPTYTVTRDLASSFAADTNPIWKAGTTIVKVGSSDGVATYSGGWLRLIGEGTNAPYYSVFSRTGVAYDGFTERVRLGNLNGIGGNVADVYGIYVGNVSTGNYMQYDDVSGDLIVNYSTISNQDIFGDGSDGDVTISGDTTLTSDMYYNNLTVDNGITLNTGGYRVFVKEILTNNGTISRVGVAGGNGNNAGGSGGTGGTAGTALATGSIYGSYAGKVGGNGAEGGIPSCTINAQNGTAGASADKSIGLAGVAGGAGNGGGNVSQCTTGTSGTGGTITGTILNSIKNVTHALNLADFQTSLAVFKPSPGSGSGGGGGAGKNVDNNANGNGGGGGGSGSGGGIVSLFARRIVNSGTITVKGGNGGNGGDGTTASGVGDARYYGGGGGGGGAGNGGAIIMVYSILTNSGSLIYTGGTGGTGGDNGLGTPADSGADGATGVLIQLVV